MGSERRGEETIQGQDVRKSWTIKIALLNLQIGGLENWTGGYRNKENRKGSGRGYLRKRGTERGELASYTLKTRHMSFFLTCWACDKTGGRGEKKGKRKSSEMEDINRGGGKDKGRYRKGEHPSTPLSCV